MTTDNTRIVRCTKGDLKNVDEDNATSQLEEWKSKTANYSFC